MKNVLKKSLMLSTLGVATVAVAGCFGGSEDSALKINFTAGNAQRHLTYNQEDPLTLPDGSTVSNGELKPTWQYIENELDIEVSDTATAGQKAGDMMSLQAADNFQTSDIFGGSGIAESLMNYGSVDGSFHDLTDYLDDMPDYKKYLEANPGSQAAYTAADGGMYHIGYTAEIDNYARAFNGRVDWVQVILDGKGATSEYELKSTVDADSKVSVEYMGSSLASDADKAAYHTGQNDVNVHDYIDDVKAHLTAKHGEPASGNLSEIFVGVNATYDMEDLVALWRIMAALPGNLSAASNGGTVDEDAVISPFFVRRQSYRDDVLRLANYFEGQRVFGADSYGSRFYLDADGELQFSHTEDKFLDSIDYIEQIYSEGLIHQDLNTSDSSNIRTEMYASDYAEDHSSFGFMTFDWFASTTNTTADNNGTKEYKIDGILPPMVKMEGVTEEVHWVDNGRAIKPDGWAIASHVTGSKLEDALDLMNYFFTEEGHLVQNYGTPDMWAEDDFVYQGESYTGMSQWTIDGAVANNNGDGSAFLRDYVGSILPIGYGKEIGLELQYTSENGLAAWNLYADAGVLHATYDNDNDLLNMTAPIFALTTQDKSLVDDMNIGNDEQDAIWLYITGADGAVADTDAIKGLYETKNVSSYITIYRNAYNKVVNGE